jgi:hypothetical protein
VFNEPASWTWNYEGGGQMEKELIVEELDNTKHMFHNFVPAH